MIRAFADVTPQEPGMGHSQAEKAANRERILEEAARQIRASGLDGVSIGGLMQRVKLTHGGFYGHFRSRSDLVAQALRRALGEGAARVSAAAKPEAGRSFQRLVDRYLSKSHRDAREQGCAIAALAGDVVRADDAARAVMDEHVEQLFANVAETMQAKDPSQAMFAAAALVGGLVLSRTLVDPARGEAVLAAVRQQLIAKSDDGKKG